MVPIKKCSIFFLLKLSLKNLLKGKQESDITMLNLHINVCTFESSQNTGSENQVSSTTTSGVRGFPLKETEAMEDVRITLFIEGVFVHDLRTLSVPFTAGSISSA